MSEKAQVSFTSWWLKWLFRGVRSWTPWRFVPFQFRSRTARNYGSSLIVTVSGYSLGGTQQWWPWDAQRLLLQYGLPPLSWMDTCPRPLCSDSCSHFNRQSCLLLWSEVVIGHQDSFFPKFSLTVKLVNFLKTFLRRSSQCFVLFINGTFRNFIYWRKVF